MIEKLDKIGAFCTLWAIIVSLNALIVVLFGEIVGGAIYLATILAGLAWAVMKVTISIVTKEWKELPK